MKKNVYTSEGYRVQGIGYGQNSYINSYDIANIQRSNGMARGDESCRDDLYSNQGFSERRTLRDSLSNSASSNLNSCEYSGGLRSQKQKRIHKLFIYFKRFFDRNRNAFDFIAKNRLFNKSSNGRITETNEFSRQITNSIEEIFRKNVDSSEGYGVWGIGYRENDKSDSIKNESELEIKPHTPYPIPHTQNIKFAKLKKGFGILEVLVAALVLGFMVIGLTQLQMGNREGVLRVRARDAANIIALHVLDSISAAGMKSIEKNIQNGDGCSNLSSEDLIYCEPNYVYYFEGKPQLDKKTSGIKIETRYNVKVSLLSDLETKKSSKDTTLFMQENDNQYSQSLEAVVSWQFKKATQSITIAKVVR